MCVCVSVLSSSPQASGFANSFHTCPSSHTPQRLCLSFKDSFKFKHVKTAEPPLPLLPGGPIRLTPTFRDLGRPGRTCQAEVNATWKGSIREVPNKKGIAEWTARVCSSSPRSLRPARLAGCGPRFCHGDAGG